MSFPKYPAYKDSRVEWIGEIPVGWKIEKFRYLFFERKEKIETEEDISGDMLSVSGYRGVEIKKYDDENKKRISYELIGYRIVRKRQLVINTMWLNFSGLGVSWLNGYVSPAYRCYSVNENIIDLNYTNYILRSSVYVLGYSKYLQGIRPNSLQMSREDLMPFPIVLPPLPEQQAIASFLDRECGKIDALIAEQKRLIALLVEKRQAVISHAVTKGLNPNVPMKDSGIPWIGMMPEGWEVHPLKNVASVQTGIAKGKEVIEQKSVQMPYLRVANVQDGYLDLSEVSRINIDRDQVERYLLRQGDVLMNEGGDFDKLGRGAIWHGEISPCIHQNHVFAVRPKSIMSEWVSAVIGSDYAKFYFMTRSKQSTNLASISSTNLMMLPIIVPSIDDQKTIVNFLENKKSQFENLMNSANSIITLLKERRAALISAAVTGKIDVRAQSKALAA